MAEAKEPPEDLPTSKADAMALLEEAEAEAAEAEALAAAARARARAARLRRQALAEAETDQPDDTETAETEAHETDEAERPAADAASADADDTIEPSSTEADEDIPEETVEAAAPESRPSRRRLRLPSLSTTLKVAAVVLIVGFAGVTGYMAWQDHEATDRSRRAANFVAGARQGIINMTSLDFNRAKEDVQRVIDSCTGYVFELRDRAVR